ncbi:MAG: chaperone NapD [Candidatus Latescibacterota bacterium]|nr:MAG: chaperone NapD [Candidatus Latescibacterota bacterium]
MTGRDPANDKSIISSIVVDTKPDACAEIRKTIESMPGADIAAGHESKLAVVLETDSSESAAALAEKIRSIKGVTGVQLVAHFFEDETRDERESS